MCMQTTICTGDLFYRHLIWGNRALQHSNGTSSGWLTHMKLASPTPMFSQLSRQPITAEAQGNLFTRFIVGLIQPLFALCMHD